MVRITPPTVAGTPPDQARSRTWHRHRRPARPVARRRATARRPVTGAVAPAHRAACGPRSGQSSDAVSDSALRTAVSAPSTSLRIRPRSDGSRSATRSRRTRTSPNFPRTTPTSRPRRSRRHPRGIPRRAVRGPPTEAADSRTRRGARRPRPDPPVRPLIGPLIRPRARCRGTCTRCGPAEVLLALLQRRHERPANSSRWSRNVSIASCCAAFARSTRFSRRLTDLRRAGPALRRLARSRRLSIRGARLQCPCAPSWDGPALVGVGRPCRPRPPRRRGGQQRRDGARETAAVRRVAWRSHSRTGLLPVPGNIRSFLVGILGGRRS